MTRLLTKKIKFCKKNIKGLFAKKINTAKKQTVLLLFCAALSLNSAYCEESSYSFNLITVVDNFLNLDMDSKSQYSSLDEKTRQKKEFTETVKKFKQGNVSVAYNDFANIISELDNDIALLVASKTMYEIGFFTLGDVAISKIKNQTFFQKQIENLKNSYHCEFPLGKQEEIYLAKEHTSIAFDNTPEETAFDLSKKTSLLEKSDYANYIMAQALLESRQYQQALMFIETAIEKNPKSPKYLSYKVEILNRSKKYKEALKFLETTEILPLITPEYEVEFKIQKEQILANLTSNEDEKKFHLISAIVLDGDYYKAINECQNILNFNKNNFKILTLQGQSQIYAGKIDSAKKNFQSALEINKKYAPALEGLGDVEYILNNPNQAVLYYKKAQKIDKNNPVLLIKLSHVLKEVPSEAKNISKIEKLVAKNVKNPFYEYYQMSAGIFKNKPKLRREFLMKSIAINPFFTPSIQEYLAYLNDNGKMTPLQNFLYMISFVNNFNYSYYYYTGIVEKHLGNRENALLNIKHSLVLNPDFEPAQKVLEDLNNVTI